MTGFDIYTNASATMYIDTGKNIAEEKYSVSFLNRILQETLPIENNIREAAGEETLPVAQQITTLDEEITYHDVLTRVAFVYELAALYQQEELDAYNSATYHAQYLQALNEAKRGVWEIMA